MKFNKKQKITFYMGLLVIKAALLLWIVFGGEVFTKTQVLIEKRNEFLGTSYKEWKDHFVLGLDYTLGFIGIAALLIGVIIWSQRTRKN
jgi:hypothetical protein